MSRHATLLGIFAGLFAGTTLFTATLCAQEAPLPEPVVEAVISVADQKMAVLRGGALLARYPVSTSKFGTGDTHNSYKTPLGRMQVCDKIGAKLAAGSVLKRRQATGEILPVNAPGRDPIVTRILWLDGLEPQNANARQRSIYIHGTPDEAHLGKPVSWGCIRMRSTDVQALFDTLQIGSPVTIITGRLPRYRKYDPSQEILIAKKSAPAAPTISSAIGKGAATEADEISNAQARLSASSFPESTLASRRTTPEKFSTEVSKSMVVRSRPVLGSGRSSTTRSGDLSRSLDESILLSGLEEGGNSEIPSLGR